MNSLMEDYKADSTIIKGAENSMSHLSNVLKKEQESKDSADTIKFKMDDELEDLLKNHDSADLMKMVEESLPELSKLESEDDKLMQERKTATDKEVNKILEEKTQIQSMTELQK